MKKIFYFLGFVIGTDAFGTNDVRNTYTLEQKDNWFNAIRNNYFDRVKLMLINNHDVNAQNKSGC